MKVSQLNKDNRGILLSGTSTYNSTLQEQVEDGKWGYRHDDALWFKESKHITYMPLAQKIIKKYPYAKNILEIGCGAGSLSNHLRDINKDIFVVTLDGNQETANSPYINNDCHFIVLTDSEYVLVDENNEVIKFDLVLSFEHFEHIHTERFDGFLENIKRHSTKKTIIIATAATWSEPRDSNHCNIKNKDMWISYLDNQGFKMVNTKIISGVEPFNFTESMTSELIFKLKTNGLIELVKYKLIYIFDIMKHILERNISWEK